MRKLVRVEEGKGVEEGLEQQQGSRLGEGSLAVDTFVEQLCEGWSWGLQPKVLGLGRVPEVRQTYPLNVLVLHQAFRQSSPGGWRLDWLVVLRHYYCWSFWFGRT